MLKAIVSGPKRLIGKMTHYPIVSFFVLLALLFAIIALTHFLRTPNPEEEAVAGEQKTSAVFTLGSDGATLSVPAEIRKEGVIRIVALSPGIVTNIYTTTGKKVSAGQVLFELTNDYQSGVSSLERQVAQNTATLTADLARTDKRIFELEEKKAKNDDTLTNTEEDIELENLKKDRETRKTTLMNNELNLQIALRNDALLKPKTLTSGVIETVKVRRGEFVTAGTTLATIKGSKDSTTLEALVSRKTLSLFDPSQPSVLEIDGEKTELSPLYFSQEETGDGLYSILFALPENILARVTNGEFVHVTLPLKSLESDTALVPIDAIFQDDGRAWVLVAEGSTATVKEVTLGSIYGSFAEIKSGLESNASVILNRAVLPGDTLTIETK
ncbi:MAG: hypothetical protein AAB615_00495 [Patescibacteria group bacterium]